MKLFIVAALFIAAAVAAPAGPDADAQILRQENDNIGTGPFNNAYETSNGISARAVGELKNVGSENEALVITGEYAYTGPDGVVYSIRYIADENGFNAQGAHIPQSP